MNQPLRKLSYLHLLLFCLCGLLPGSALAQAPSWQALATSTTGSLPQVDGTLSGRITARAADGDLYVAGSISGHVALGNTVLTSTGSTDLYLAKWSVSTGQWRWIQQVGGSSAESVEGLVVSGNNVYLAGKFFSPTISFGGSTLTHAGNGDLFVAKFTDNASGTGNWTWAMRGGGSNYDDMSGLALSGNNLYLTGLFQTTTSFGGTSLTGQGSSNDIFLAKLTDNGSTGSWGWALRAGGTSSDFGNAVAVSGSDVYLVAAFQGSNVAFGSQTLSSAGGSDVLVARVADNGSTASWVWAQRAGGTSSDFAQSVVVSGGSVYVGGYCNGPATFGATSLPSAGNSDIFVAKLADSPTAGTWTWALSMGGPSSDTSWDLAVNGSSVYLAGQFQGTLTTGFALSSASSTAPDALVAKLTDAGSSASWTWAQRGGGLGSDYGYGLTLSGTTLYLAGQFTSPEATFGTAAGSPLRTGREAVNVLVAQLTDQGPDGRWDRVQQGYTGGNFTGLATATDAAGNAYVAGKFEGQVSFGATTLTSAGKQDAFVAKWDATARAWAWAQRAGGEGDDQALSVAVSGSSVYVAGDFLSPGIDVGSFTFTNAGLNTRDLFVARLSDSGPTGTWTWAQAAGGPSDEYPQSIVTGNGAVYFGGYFNGDNLTLGTTTLTNMRQITGFGSDGFVAKLTDNGTGLDWTWVRQTGRSIVTALAVSGPNVYAGGGFVSNAVFGSITLSTPVDGWADIYVAKLTDAGSTASWTWAQRAGGNYTDEVRSLAASGSNVYVGGIFGGSGAVFGSTSLTNGSSGSDDGYLARLTDAGSTASWTWAQRIGGNTYDDVYAVAARGNEVYVAGEYQSATLTLGTSTQTLGLTGFPTMFVARLTEAGAWTWVQQSQASSGTHAYGLALSASAVYLTGYAGTPAAFGTLSLSSPAGNPAGYLAALGDAPLPIVSSFSPASELPGMPVVITGTGFTNITAVRFNGQAVPAGSFTVDSPTRLTVTVPVGAPSGPLSVVTAAGTATSGSSFTALQVALRSAGQCQSGTPLTSTGDGQWHYLLAGGQVVAAINDQGVALGTVQATFNTAPSSPVLYDAGSRPFLARSWQLTAANGFAGRQVRVRFYGLPAEYAALKQVDGGLSSYADLRLSQYSGPNDDCELLNNDRPGIESRLLTPVATPVGAEWFGLETVVADHFSEFYVHTGNRPLPVTLTRFAAEARGPVAHLSWTTAQEIRNQGFHVESSTDGRSFRSVGWVPGHGDQTTARDYAFDDPGLPGYAGPVVYYRLRQLDVDGTATYSDVRTLDRPLTSLQVWPNPARHAVRVSGPAPGQPVTVQDALGRTISRQPMPAAGPLQLTLPPGQPAGVYFVRGGGQVQRLLLE